MTADDLRFPIGPFTYARPATAEERRQRIAQIERTPEELRAAARGLSAAQLDTPYRPGGWTVRQVVHHVPDSHLNAVIRFKLALTESSPTIKPYDEARWAELGDVAGTPVEVSLRLLHALHERWVVLLRSLAPAEFERTLVHPERNATMTLDEVLALYAWHGPHHTAHITRLRARSGWDAGV
ncbi:MAG: YfiT family bacillithiol transferase [Bacillota bacterium]